MPSPLSATVSQTRLPSSRISMKISVADGLCRATFSSRFSSTCSMSVASIGTSRISSGFVTAMGMSVAQFLRKRRMALPTISSTTSSDFSMTTPSSLKRVTDRMFSDRCSSHCAFWRISSTMPRPSSESVSPSSTVALRPMIAASGVRISCETLRRRLARMRSFSAS